MGDLGGPSCPTSASHESNVSKGCHRDTGSWAAAAIEQAGVPVVASPASDAKFKVFLRLKRSGLHVEQLTELAGDARPVGTIQRIVPNGKTVEVGQILPGLPSSNRAQRRQGRSSAGEDNSIKLRYPGAVVTPIAVFR